MNISLENMILGVSVLILFSALGYLNYRSIMKRAERLEENLTAFNKKLTKTKHF